jgi:hypothetical protein
MKDKEIQEVQDIYSKKSVVSFARTEDSVQTSNDYDRQETDEPTINNNQEGNLELSIDSVDAGVVAADVAQNSVSVTADSDEEAIIGYIVPDSRSNTNKETILVEGVTVSKKGNRNAVVAIIVIVVMIVAIAVGLVVGLQYNDDPVTESPSAFPSASPSMAPTAEELVLVLDQIEEEGLNFYESTTSPGYRAALWMAEQNLFELPFEQNATTDRIKFRQRFAMAALYYSTDGDNSWIDDCNFLSELSICDWTCPLPDHILNLTDAEKLAGYGAFWDLERMGVYCMEDTMEDIAIGVALRKFS